MGSPIFPPSGGGGGGTPGGLELGETSSTAYRGDRGKTAYDHSQTAHAPANAQKNSDITKAEIEAKLTGAISSHSHAGPVIVLISNAAQTPESPAVGQVVEYIGTGTLWTVYAYAGHQIRDLGDDIGNMITAGHAYASVSLIFLGSGFWSVFRAHGTYDLSIEG